VNIYWGLSPLPYFTFFYLKTTLQTTIDKLLVNIDNNLHSEYNSDMMKTHEELEQLRLECKAKQQRAA